MLEAMLHELDRKRERRVSAVSRPAALKLMHYLPEKKTAEPHEPVH
jgi:hypothetical protein